MRTLERNRLESLTQKASTCKPEDADKRQNIENNQFSMQIFCKYHHPGEAA